MADYIPDNGWGGLSKYQYEDHRHMPLFLINGMIPPDNFRYGYTESTEQLVKSQRNSKGVVVAKKVGEAYDNSTGKRLLKFDGLEWPILPNSDYRWLQEQIEKFYCYVTYYDSRAGFHPMGSDPFGDPSEDRYIYSTGVQTDGRVVTKKFYWGDFSAEPWKFTRDTDVGILIPSYYINVKVNLIDCGEPYLEPGDRNYVDPSQFGPPYRGEDQWPSEY